MSAPLARAAAAFTAARGWHAHGYARLDDHARERFHRTGRWIRDLALIGRALDALPGLEQALTGRDGGPPLTLAAARLIAAESDATTVGDWVQAARALSARELRARIRARNRAPDAAAGQGPGQAGGGGVADVARAAGAGLPSTHAIASLSAARDEDSGRHLELVRLAAPEPVVAAFDEGLELYRAVEGREAGVTGFIEALVAEAASGGLVELPDEGPPRSTEVDSSAGSASRAGSGSRAGAGKEAGLGPRLDSLPSGSPRGGRLGPRTMPEPMPGIVPEDDDRRLARCLTLRRALERALDQVLVRIGLLRAWAALGCAGLEPYAVERLGMAPRTVRERAMLCRGLQRLPELRHAFERDEVGVMAALEVVRLLASHPAAGAETRHAWVERARRATVKRLRDEARALRRRRGLAESDGEPRPLTDAGWQASLVRRTGDARRRVARLAARAREQAQSGASPALRRMGWRLPAGLANDFRRAMAAAAARGRSGAWAPGWHGLLALVEGFVASWDVDHSPQRPSRVAIYVRDGWRCMAPGCTSRRNLEDHHVTYRSRGGDDAADNRVCLCRFHHQRGEHGELARVRGRAPLGLVWSLGRGGRGGAFRNELRC